MDKNEFTMLRERLGKTQKEMALLLGTSIKAIHSYEQGWRRVPMHVERQVYLLVSLKDSVCSRQRPCWVVKKCPQERKTVCPAWEFQAGTLCWFISGTMCEGLIQKNWQDKMDVCRTCELWSPYFHPKNS